MLKILPIVAAVLVAGLLVTPTVSQASETSSAVVPYADLNLASQPGQDRLERRIAQAARTVCQIEDSKEISLARATNACRSDAIASAQPAFEAAVAAARRGSVTVIGGVAALTVSAQ